VHGRNRDRNGASAHGRAQYAGSRFQRLNRRAGAAKRPKAVDPRQRALATLVGSLPLRIIMTDLEMRVVAMSRSSAATMGGEAAAIGRSVYDLDPDYFLPYRPICERCLAGETFLAPRIRARPGGGPELWLRTEISPWRDVRGRIAGLVSVSTDITDMAAAIDRITRSEERLNIAMEIADLHVWEADYLTQESVTAGARDTFFDGSFTEAEMIRDPSLAIHPEDRARIFEPWLAAVIADRPFRTEYRINRRDGKEVWAVSTAKVIRDETGQPVRMIGAMQNITAQKQAEAALVQAKEDAEAANRAKSAFLATMSHEIRTPLNGVLGMAQAMENDELEPVQRRRLSTIRQSGEALLLILNDLLDLSKIEAGKLELEATEFALTPLLEGVCGGFVEAAARKGVGLVLDTDASAPGIYRGDPTRLRQILFNLVSNALKFTEVGEVRLSARRDGDTLILNVTDTGIGIAPDRLSRLFNKFEQADASTTRRFGGTGLGLAISRDLATLMGALIDASSVEGAGSDFRLAVDLPRLGDERGLDAAATAAPHVTSERALRVLAAEDNAVNQVVLRTLLQQFGIEPMIVANGAAAVTAWRGEDWDVILMDVQMPVMDGPSAARAIRTGEAASGRARTPIVALTANAMSHQIAEYRAAGMDGVVAKPIRVEELLAALQASLEAPDAEVAA
jgi:PAS domain S-box-containing protein